MNVVSFSNDSGSDLKRRMNEHYDMITKPFEPGRSVQSRIWISPGQYTSSTDAAAVGNISAAMLEKGR